MINPYVCYALSFLLALVTYTLDWSALYPKLSLPLVLFLVITIIIHILLGISMARKKKITFTAIKPGNETAAIYVTIFIFLLWTWDFIYEGGIPLLKILLEVPYNYRLFGVPSLHVFTVTFSSFYTIYLFHIYLSTRKKIILCLYLINLGAAILIYSRAMFVFNLTGSFILFLLYRKALLGRLWYTIPVLLIVLSYFFGVLGTLRVSRESHTGYDNSLFTDLGQPTEAFSQSNIPHEFFWTYIYITSPLANLQHNINYYPAEVSLARAGEMINNEVLMDFISKRINTLLGQEREREYTIPGPFNVST